MAYVFLPAAYVKQRQWNKQYNISEINEVNVQEIIRMLAAFLATQQQQIHSSQTQDLINEEGDVEDKMVTLE